MESAFAQLIEERSNKLYRTAWAILRNDADAFDATQEACLSAWRELPRLRDPQAFDAWLSRSLVNRCRTMLRERKRTMVREVPIEADQHSKEPATEGGLDGGFASSEAIRRAFARLSSEDRTYLALHYAQDRSIEEMSQLVGAPAGTVKWRLARARAALERQLAREAR